MGMNKQTVATALAVALLGGCSQEIAPEEPTGKPPAQESSFSIEGLAMEMLWCPAGTFWTGSPDSEVGRDFDEVLREVTLTSGFWLGKHEVTQAQWKMIMGNNPSHFKGPKLPVEKMSWEGANTFCSKLTKRERKAGRLPPGWAYQLPTEAQWEYACRAGAQTSWNFGDSPQAAPKHINFADNKSNLEGAQKEYDDGFEYTAPVGSFPANAWGFHEMHGNVFEWCSDWYGQYEPEATRDPSGPLTGTERIFRGGCWALPMVFSRSARRDKHLPILESGFLGLRLCLRPEQ